MTIKKIKAAIINFKKQKKITHASYMSNFFKNFNEMNDIIKALLEILRDENEEIVFYGYIFISYLIKNTKLIPGKLDDIFIKMIEEDYEIFDVLNSHLYSKNIYIRRIIGEILISLGYEDCLEFLHDSVEYYFKNDPINLPLILNNIIKLSGEIPWFYIDKAVKNNNYIVRWSFLGLCSLVNLEYKNLYMYLDILQKDKNEYIREEAEFWYNYYKRVEENELSGVFNEDSEEIDLFIPDFNFFFIIDNYFILLNEIDKKDYTIKELDDFINFFLENYNHVIDLYIKEKNL